MIDAIGITKTYSNGSSEVHAVEDVNFHVSQGEFALILGRSGSGKSTLLGMLAGLIRPTIGIVRMKGLEIGNLTDDRIAELRAKEIGFVFQFSGLIPTITAYENVLLPTLFCHDGPGSRNRALELLEIVGMQHRAEAYPATLSSGEMKRVAIARALINGPSLLIADEPTGDLDVKTEYEIMELFRQLNNNGTTVVMVTHNPDLIPFCSRSYWMDQGRLVEETESS